MHLLAPKEKGRLLGHQGKEEKEEVASMLGHQGRGEGGGCFHARSSREGGGGVYPYEEEEWQ